MATTAIAPAEFTSRPGAALEAVLATIVQPDEVESKLALLEAQIQQCRSAFHSLLPMELSARRACENKLKELVRDRRNLKYPRVSSHVLRWRDGNGLPVFALFDPHSPEEFRISEEANSLRHLPYPLRGALSDIPDRLRTLQRDAIDKLGRMKALLLRAGNCIFGAKLHIAARYSGLVPYCVKVKIQNASTDFERIYILAEVPEWRLGMIATPRIDPIVLGLCEGSLHFITAYDTTPLEDYVKEFIS